MNLPKPARASRSPVTEARKTGARAARTRARVFALQGLYQFIVGRQPVDDIDPFTRDLSGFHKADRLHFDALLHGCATEADSLNTHLQPLLDRPIAELSPIEHAVLWIGAYEMLHCLDVPWRVVINECIELAKAFGGTDGHKYVNAVLNGLAPKLRPDEWSTHAASSAPTQAS